MSKELNLFEIAITRHFRFESGSSLGLLTLEDLTNLPLIDEENPGRTTLNSIAKALYARTKDETVSFVTAVQPSAAVAEDIVKLNIVKRVIEIRENQIKDKQDEESKAARRRELMASIARLKNKEDEVKSLEELQNELSSL